MSDDDEIVLPPKQPKPDEQDWKAPLDAPTPVNAFRPSSMPPPSSGPNPLDAPTPVTSWIPSSIPPVPSTQPAIPRRQTLRPGLAPGLFGLTPPEPPRSPAADPPPMEVIELEVDSIPSGPVAPVSGPPLDGLDRPSGPLLAEESLESRSRLVSAPPVALGPDASEPQIPSEPTLEIAAAEISASELAALEADHAPTSSRRPISMEEKMNEPEDAVPLHTPPPASGKLLAAAPAIELEAVQANLPPRVEVAVFVTGSRGEGTGTSFGELLDDALSL